MPELLSGSAGHAPFRLPLLILLKHYGLKDLRSDVMAGITVGVVAVPLAMALAIASGVPPQYGLYTSIVAGLVIALAGGSRFNVSGPTAAFVVILLPITHEHGLGGLLVTTVMAGAILVVMGAAGVGRFIQFIPYPVTTGFTAGIAVVIATLQIKDFLGLEVTELPAHFIEKVAVLGGGLSTLHWPDLLVGILTLAVLVVWPRLKISVPGHPFALLVGALAAWLLSALWPDLSVATIGSRFEYSLDGVSGHGIPPAAPSLLIPWHLPNAAGDPIGLSWALIRDLLPAAFTVAMLGAIESLLCAVVADGLGGGKHNPNAELVGQGLGNLVAPFFGGIPATGAIARTATSIRAGARTPVAAMVHAATVLLAVVSLAPLLGHVPMAALAALLLMVAWNMSEAKHFGNILRVAPRSDALVLLTCFGLTVMFDMVIAVAAGVVLASVLFMQRIAAITGAELLTNDSHAALHERTGAVAVYDVNGPLFFGAAQKAVNVLYRTGGNVRVVILDMTDVPMIDMTGVVALDSLIRNLERRRIAVLLVSNRADVRFLLADALREHGGITGSIYASLADAHGGAEQLLTGQSASGSSA